RQRFWATVEHSDASRLFGCDRSGFISVGFEPQPDGSNRVREKSPWRDAVAEQLRNRRRAQHGRFPMGSLAARRAKPIWIRRRRPAETAERQDRPQFQLETQTQRSVELRACSRGLRATRMAVWIRRH